MRAKRATCIELGLASDVPSCSAMRAPEKLRDARKHVHRPVSTVPPSRSELRSDARVPRGTPLDFIEPTGRLELPTGSLRNRCSSGAAPLRNRRQDVEQFLKAHDTEANLPARRCPPLLHEIVLTLHACEQDGQPKYSIS